MMPFYRLLPALLLSTGIAAAQGAAPASCVNNYVVDGPLTVYCHVLQPGGQLPVFLPPGTSAFQVFVETTSQKTEGYKVTVTHDGITSVLRVGKNPDYPQTLAQFFLPTQQPDITSVTVVELVAVPALHLVHSESLP